MIVQTGSYTGTGAGGNAIATGNAPDLVIVKAKSVSATGAAVAKTSTMATDLAKDLDSNSTALESLITLSGTGFTPVASDARVNSNGVVYNWLAIEMESGDTEFEVGSYNGNGSDNRNISLATVTGTPGVVMIFGDYAAGAFWRSNVHSGDLSQWFSSVAAATTNGIQSFGAGTFQVGTRDQVNRGTGTPTYHYVAIMEVANKFEVATYTGNATDNRSLTGAGFAPTFAMVQARDSSARGMVLRGPAHTGDATSFISSTGDTTDHIQAFESDGIQIGANSRVNANTEVFTVMYFAPPAGPSFQSYRGLTRSINPADWDGTVDVILEVHGLTTGGNFEARLYNVTDAAVVSGSEIAAAAPTLTRLRSDPFSFASGTKVYEVQYGGDPGEDYTIEDAVLIVDVS